MTPTQLRAIRLALGLSQTEMAELQDELALAQRESGAIAERTRISRDIHDTIAQAPSSIRLLAHAGAGRTGDADAAFESFDAGEGSAVGVVAGGDEHAGDHEFEVQAG